MMHGQISKKYSRACQPTRTGESPNCPRIEPRGYLSVFSERLVIDPLPTFEAPNQSAKLRLDLVLVQNVTK